MQYFYLCCIYKVNTCISRMEELELSEQCRLGNNQARKELYEQYARAYAWHLSALYRRP